MDVKELLRGIIVVIDDEIENKDSEISKIISKFENDKFPIVKYKTIPDNGVVDSLSSASLIILDWDFKKNEKIKQDLDELIIMPESTTLDALSILPVLLEKIFVPIFIFTNQVLDDVKAKLTESGLEKQIDKRIFIKKKGRTGE